MASITNAQAVAFANNIIRPLFDSAMQLYYSILEAQQMFTAQGLNSLIPNDGTQLVVDGSATDGRTPITGADVQILLSNMATVASLFTANTNLILNQTLKGSVNPTK